MALVPRTESRKYTTERLKCYTHFAMHSSEKVLVAILSLSPGAACNDIVHAQWNYLEICNIQGAAFVTGSVKHGCS